ncbi:MAG: hypothetical protein SP1CHLAM54_08530 [Chlamydiia bacterium]|nr:hypothetical protein [Chlamydiia bacterium]MCH9615759.1 hypothetical protein [Chlamydiia bacterium]MCH9628838.1 hypothetical protein [Chlamydiia bacterium]
MPLKNVVFLTKNANKNIKNTDFLQKNHKKVKKYQKKFTFFIFLKSGGDHVLKAISTIQLKRS